MLVLIVLLCANGMTPKDCETKWLERYQSIPVPPSACIEQVKAVQEMSPKSPAGYYLVGCGPAPIYADKKSR